MAILKVNTTKIVDNIIKLDKFLRKNDITWTLTTKITNGHKKVLEKIILNDSIKNLHSIGDARISNLRVIKEIRPDIKTVYLKPPAIKQVKNVIKYADISLNSSYHTINELNKEAKAVGKIHEIVVMIEMGELREGVIRENIVSFYQQIFELSNIKIIGLGTNLGCMYGVEPTYDKLIQLSLYKLLLEEKFERKIDLVSGGSSITLSLINQKKLPQGVNHLRIGETAFLGRELLENGQFLDLHTDAFEFEAEIVELEKKEYKPDGVISEVNIGHTQENDSESGETYRAIVDFGLIDVDYNNLTLKDEHVKFFGTTSDMTVYDLGASKYHYKVGNRICFTPNYMAIARLMNSKYITKEII